MSLKCPNCGSSDTQTLVDRDQCLNCGVQFSQGEVMRGGANDDVLALHERAGRAPEQNVVGNLADLQRLGAAVIEEGKATSTVVADAFHEPPGLNKDMLPDKDTEDTKASGSKAS